MKKIFLIIVIITTFVFSCTDSLDDCSSVSCLAGDEIELTFFKNNQNIFETNPSLEITFIQERDTLYFDRNIEKNKISLSIEKDDPITIIINDQVLNMTTSSTLKEGKCCNYMEIDTLKINDSIICDNSESCNEVLSFNLD